MNVFKTKWEEKICRMKKVEQVFLLVFMCCGVFGTLCAMGCGGGCTDCEKPQCYFNERDDDKDRGCSYGCSVPGCGGCLTPECGINSCIWPQSFKCGYGETHSFLMDQVAAFVDIEYYGGGCLGCNQERKSCYVGTMDRVEDSWLGAGVFVGCSDCAEIEVFLPGCVEIECDGPYTVEEAIYDVESGMEID